MLLYRITLEEYLRSIKHEDVAGEDISLDNVDIISDLEEEDLETIKETMFDSRVLINMDSSMIIIGNRILNTHVVILPEQ